MRVLCLLLLSAVPVLAGSFTEDTSSVLAARKRLREVTEFMKEHPLVFPEAKIRNPRLLTRAERMMCWEVWQTFMDRIVALDKQAQRYYQRSRKTEGVTRSQAQKLRFAAFLAQYHYALEFIRIAEHNPALHKVLNEEVPELGLKPDTYKELKLRFLHVKIATQFSGLNMLDKVNRLTVSDELEQVIETDKRYIWKAGVTHGTKNTFKNVFDLGKDLSHDAWFPVQKRVSDWMGDTKVWRRETSLITAEQIKGIHRKLEPGDVLLVRHEWYLSNIGLPGFWPHAALYIGTPAERKAYFADIGYDLEAKLKTKYPEAYKTSTSVHHGNPPRVLEAISEGVSFTTLSHCLEADSMAALRPRLSKKEKALAIQRAFHYSGRPYDFDFDFQTDAALVCTELIYKSYEPNEGMTGLKLPLVRIIGRNVMPANQIALLFHQEYDTADQQFDFIAFLDGHEDEERAVSRGVGAFRKSHTRSKWYIWKDQGEAEDEVAVVDTVAVKISWSGKVQGVGLRKYVQRLAEKHGLVGWVINMPNGDVLAHVEGKESAVGRLIADAYRGPKTADVEAMKVEQEKVAGGLTSFAIKE